MQKEDTEIDLGKYWNILKRRWLPAVLILSGITVAASLYGRSQTPLYQAEGKLKFSKKDAASDIAGFQNSREELVPISFRDNPIATEIGVMKTAPVVEQTIESIDLRNESGELITHGQFLSRLDISKELGSDLLKIVYRAPDTATAEAAVNTLMAVYLEANLESNRAEATKAREFIESQIPDAEGKARQAEAALREFKESNEIVALETETQSTVKSLSDVTEQITDLTAQLYDAEAQFALLQSRIGSDPQTALTTAAVSQADGVQALLQEYQQVQSELATERVRFQEQHPVVVDLKAKLSNLESLLSQRVGSVVGGQSLTTADNLQTSELEIGLIGDYVRLEARIDGLRQQVETLIAAENSYAARADQIPRLEEAQEELLRQVEVSQSTYSLLLQRLQEAIVAENQKVGNATVVQPAEATLWPVSPNQKLYISIGVLLGSLLGVSTSFLLEARDKSVKTVEEIKQHFYGRPMLGIIPNFKDVRCEETALDENIKVPQLIVVSQSGSPASESFHMLRSNLRYLSSDHPPKVMAITSSVPGEGKSTVVANLAASIAQTGSNVLVIDADFHRATQHWVWNVQNRNGLSDLLAGQVSLTDSLKEIMPNLMLMPAGSVPPYPASLLDSQKMIALLGVFRKQFDYVVIDTPPMIGGASASILGKISDGLLYVVRPKVADTDSIGYAKELIERSQQNILGMVVNGALNKYEPYSYFLSEEFYDGYDIDPRVVVEADLESSVAPVKR